MSDPVHFSTLKWIGKSPAHYRHNLEHPVKQTRAMRLGEALDAMLFKTKEVITFDGASRRGKAWDAFEDEHPESVTLLAPELEQAAGMLAAVQANTQARELLLGGTSQQLIEWEIGGRKCAGTPDVFSKTSVVELKTCRNSGVDRFPRDARFMAYHAQLAWYHYGLELTGRSDPLAKCYIVAVESTAPWPVTIFELTNRAYDEGKRTWSLWFERLLVCEKSGQWPDYSQAIVPFDTPDTEGLTLQIDGEEVEVQ